MKQFKSLPALLRTSDPTNSDIFTIGRTWINQTTDEAFILVDVTAGSANWANITDSAGTVIGDLDVPGDLTIDGQAAGKNNDIGNSSASQDISLSDGNFQEITLSVATTTITFTNEVAAGNVSSITLVVKQDGTGGRLITWDGAVKWAYGNAPTLSSGASEIDIFSFFTPDGGTTWYGVMSAKDVS